MNVLSIASFTNLGYRLNSARYRPLDQKLAGKTVVVTGGTGGLGLSAASGLAELGARVAIVGRNREKLETARNAIDGEVAIYQADLSLLSEIRDLAERISDRERRLDVLINNVGVLFPGRHETREGLEASFATNLAGHFLLTNLLVPKLSATSPSRVVNVSSGGMYSQRIRPDDLQSERGAYNGSTTYARTKRGQVILTEMWAERLKQLGVVVHSMHPGWARTKGVRSSLPKFHTIMGPLLRSPQQGADTIVWLASAPEPGQSTGRFWFDRSPVPTHLIASTKETAAEREDLWERLALLTDSDVDAAAGVTG